MHNNMFGSRVLRSSQMSALRLLIGSKVIERVMMFIILWRRYICTLHRMQVDLIPICVAMWLQVLYWSVQTNFSSSLKQRHGRAVSRGNNLSFHYLYSLLTIHRGYKHPSTVIVSFLFAHLKTRRNRKRPDNASVCLSVCLCVCPVRALTLESLNTFSVCSFGTSRWNSYVKVTGSRSRSKS